MALKKISMYTDGACRGNPDGPGGYGTVLEYITPDGRKQTKELSGGYEGTTNNRMELLAVIKGFEALKEPCQVTVYSDSKYIVNAFNQQWLDNWQRNNWTRGRKKEPVKNKDLWQQLLTVKDKHQVSFEWVKGHAGQTQNERCDQLATTAADSGQLMPDLRRKP